LGSLGPSGQAFKYLFFKDFSCENHFFFCSAYNNHFIGAKQVFSRLTDLSSYRSFRTELKFPFKAWKLFDHLLKISASWQQVLGLYSFEQNKVFSFNKSSGNLLKFSCSKNHSCFALLTRLTDLGSVDSSQSGRGSNSFLPIVPADWLT
jgi:hypothetical protein